MCETHYVGLVPARRPHLRSRHGLTAAPSSPAPRLIEMVIRAAPVRGPT
jgi:hypothetical protein